MRRYVSERPSVVPSYAPPAGLRAGEAGVVIDSRVDSVDVVAAVVDLAVRGILELHRLPHDTLVRVARPWLHEKDIRPFEVVLLAHVFTDGAREVRLSELRGQGYAPTSIKETLSLDLDERGLFTAGPLAVRRAGRWLALIVLAVWTQLAWNAHAGPAVYVRGIETALLVWLLAVVVSRGGLTPHGRHMRNQLLGFREYLARAEKDRLEKLRPNVLDEHLPWAIALGVTEAWVSPAISYSSGSR